MCSDLLEEVPPGPGLQSSWEQMTPEDQAAIVRSLFHFRCLLR